MKGRRVRIRFLDQRLVVPDPHAVETCEVCCHLSDARVKDEFPHGVVGLPQVDQLIEDVAVELGLLLVDELVAHDGRVVESLTLPAGDSGIDPSSPGVEFLGIEKALNHDEPVALVLIDLCFC